jgi:hypothetical protein
VTFGGRGSDMTNPEVYCWSSLIELYGEITPSAKCVAHISLQHLLVFNKHQHISLVENDIKLTQQLSQGPHLP